MKHAGSGAAGGKPHVYTFCRDTGVAGGECAFSVESRRKLFRIDVLPDSSAVASAEDLEFSVHWIADHEPVFGVGERHAIEEAVWLMVGELQFPAVSFALMVDARFVARASGEEERFTAKCVNTAEVEVIGAGNVVHGPSVSAIFRDEIRAVCAAGLDFIAIDDAHTAQGFGGMARLRLPLGEG